MLQEKYSPESCQTEPAVDPGSTGLLPLALGTEANKSISGVNTAEEGAKDGTLGLAHSSLWPFRVVSMES
jgi:hypothetical protein